jgi:hypothetical protein
MGLDTSHDCWHGAYSAFMRWREKLAEVAGYGDLRQREGFGGGVKWPEGDPLTILLSHSDCDGEIAAEDCASIADRLEQLMPALKIAGEAGGHIGNFADKTQQFIDGLRTAAAANEPVDFG